MTGSLKQGIFIKSVVHFLPRGSHGLKTRSTLIPAIVAFCFVTVARGQGTSPVDLERPMPSYLVAFADEHRWTVEFLGTTLGDVTNRHLVMGGATVGVGYYIFDNLAIDMDLTGYGFNEGRLSGEAVGWTLGLRHHLLKIEKASLFMDVSGGLIEASQETPYRGTHFNDTFEVGPGVAYPLEGNTYLIGGVHYFHLSNGNRAGRDRNPSVNAVQGVLGVMFRF